MTAVLAEDYFLQFHLLTRHSDDTGTAMRLAMPNKQSCRIRRFPARHLVNTSPELRLAHVTANRLLKQQLRVVAWRLLQFLLAY